MKINVFSDIFNQRRKPKNGVMKRMIFLKNLLKELSIFKVPQLGHLIFELNLSNDLIVSSLNL